MYFKYYALSFMQILVGKTEIMDSLGAPAHSFTMSGNSTVCAAYLKMIEIFERENLVQQSKEKGEYLISKLKELQKKYNIIKYVRGLGLSIGVDLDSKEEIDKGLEIIEEAIKEYLAGNIGDEILSVIKRLVIIKIVLITSKFQTICNIF